LLGEGGLGYFVGVAITRQRQELGRRGENEAAQFLSGRGYVVIGRNYRSPHGEIDLIVQDRHNRRMIVFVEVRTNSAPQFGDPLASVNARKQRQVAKTAQYYLVRHGLENHEARFDVIGIRWELGQARISHIQGAFELPRSW
jgi:putative endonuclease